MADRYEGEYKDGKYHGKGKLYFDENDDVERLYYEGDFEDGEPHGIGKMVWKNGDECEGEWKNGYSNGIAEYRFADGSVFKGEYVDGVPNGKGKSVWSSGHIYEGDYKDGLPHGKGTYYWPNGQYYEGDFYKDNFSGQGFMDLTNGETYKGGYLNGKRHGHGVYTYSDGRTYVGNFSNGSYNGYGKYTTDKFVYEGFWENDKYNGVGMLRHHEYVDVGYFMDGKLEDYGFKVRRNYWISMDNFRHDSCISRTILRHDHSVTPKPLPYVHEYPADDKRRFFVGNEEMTYGVLWMRDNIIYAGEVKNGAPYKHGAILYPVDDPEGKYHYVGDVDGLLPDGNGELTWSLDGKTTMVYKGKFVKGVREGFAKYHDAEDNYYECNFKNSRMFGQGTIKFKGGSTYSGDIDNGKMHGKGVYVSSENERYEGEFYANERHGKGKCTMPDGTVLEGTWVHGEYKENDGNSANAVLSVPFEAPKKIFVSEFSKEALCALLNCDTLTELSTEALSILCKRFNLDVVCLCNGTAAMDGAYENSFACKLTDYPYIYGPCIICGKSVADYIPLTQEALQAIIP